MWTSDLERARRLAAIESAGMWVNSRNPQDLQRRGPPGAAAQPGPYPPDRPARKPASAGVDVDFFTHPSGSWRRTARPCRGSGPERKKGTS